MTKRFDKQIKIVEEQIEKTYQNSSATNDPLKQVLHTLLLQNELIILLLKKNGQIIRDKKEQKQELRWFFDKIKKILYK